VELLAGARPVVRVDAAGVLVHQLDLLVPWIRLGVVVGFPTSRFSTEQGALDLYVSRTWWTDELGRAPQHRDERGAWEALLVTTFTSFWRPVPGGDFADWLTAEAVLRAPLPPRLALTPAPGRCAFDRDSGRDVPLDRLPISHSLRADLEAWAAGAATVPDLDQFDGTTWEQFWPPGRELASRVEQETGLPTAVWADCPEVP
jgi:hypothetical protein